MSPFGCIHRRDAGALFDRHRVYGAHSYRDLSKAFCTEWAKSCNWLQLRVASGLAIPYIVYMELDVQLCGKQIPNCGILVVKDPPSALNHQVPGVLGVNVLGKCYQDTKGTIASHTAGSATQTIQEQIAQLDLSCLPNAEQGQVRALLGQFHTVFSTQDGDLELFLSRLQGEGLKAKLSKCAFF